MRKQWLTLAIVVACASGVLAFAQAQDTVAPPPEAPAEPSGGGVVQPIDFPHSIHAGQLQMDCQYCHFSAERSVDAGLPPVRACMGCHTLIAGTANPGEIEKLRGYAQRDEQIPWVRIYKVADHVHFPHMRHIHAGIECQTCHGQVQEMGAITERAPEWGAENMGWCISCHVQENVRRDCTVCHY